MTKSISVAFTANGEGKMACAGLGTFACLGRPGRQYPTDLTVTPADKSAEHWSTEFHVLMKFCILIWGQKGIYIHAGPDNLKDNGGPSAGCIHVGLENARRVYEWLDEQTRITISYPWRMGDGEVEIWNILNRVGMLEQRLRAAKAQSFNRSDSADKIVAAAKSYADSGKVFDKGCSDMVRSAYAEGGITIPDSYAANDIVGNYPCIADPQPGDIAGWQDNPNGHVVIYLGPNSYANCPGEGQPTKYNSNMDHSLSYLRPS
jgi:L,D-transpeptidase catalytic domain/NlpC/P60 family